MKINIFLWLMAFTFTGKAVNAQLAKNVATDPSAQLKELIRLPQLSMPSVKMPTSSKFFHKPLMPGYDIKKTIEQAKLMCPLLNSKSTILLQGERANDQEVGLQWKTTHAFYSNAFDVERSLGDSLHFEKVNFVWAKGNKIKEKYQLPDNNDYNELSYYRIKMLFFDGNFSYSNIAEVKGYDKFLFSIYPNPASAGIWIALSSKVRGKGNISIIDSEGKTVLQYSSFVTDGYNQKDIDIARLPTGVYTIKATLPDKHIRFGKLVKN
jgi:hypothetical protein